MKPNQTASIEKPLQIRNCGHICLILNSRLWGRLSVKPWNGLKKTSTQHAINLIFIWCLYVTAYMVMLYVTSILDDAESSLIQRKQKNIILFASITVTYDSAELNNCKAVGYKRRWIRFTTYLHAVDHGNMIVGSFWRERKIHVYLDSCGHNDTITLLSSIVSFFSQLVLCPAPYDCTDEDKTLPSLQSSLSLLVIYFFSRMFWMFGCLWVI